MKKLYDKFMDLNIKSAREKAARRGLSFNEENFIKKQEAVLPILFFYGLVIILGFILPSVVTLVPSWIFFAILFGLIIRGLNHYFGWIRVEK
jgi:hypothetical protein